jgi:hypothetical protein
MLHVDSNTTLRFEDWPEIIDLISNSLDKLHSDDNRQKVEEPSASTT